MILVGLFATDSRADWQYTTWGATPAQVEEAMAKAGVTKLPPPQAVEKQQGRGPSFEFRGDYKTGRFQFSALFGFERSSGKLVEVRLVPESGSECGSIKEAMLDQYGPVESESVEHQTNLIKSVNLRWRDVTAKNTVVMNDYVAMGTRGCAISYKPLLAGKGSGL